MSDTPPHASNGRERTPDLTSKREKRPRDAEEDDRDRHGSSRRRHREDYANDEEYERDRERRHRERQREREEDPEREERRRRRHHDDETEEEREERRRRRREREMRDRERGDEDPNYERDRYRERERERGADSGGYRGRELIDDGATPRSAGRSRSEYGGADATPERGARRDSRPRDKSRDSYRSRDGVGAPSIRELSREEKEAERERRDRERRDRERRDREMADERRERARHRDGPYDRMDRDRRDDRRRSPPPPPRDYPSPRRRRGSPGYDNAGGPRGGPPPPPPPPLDPAEALIQSFDSENRSIFISQLATRLTSQDLGLFFEDKLGRGAVRDARVVTDRGSKRSKGIGYVELDDVSLVNKALALSGTIVMGIPIVIQLTEAEKNHEGKTAAQLAAEATRFLSGPSRGPREHREPAIQFPPLSTGLRMPPGFDPQAHQEASVPYYRLFVTGLAYTLNEQDIAAVFEPFGQVEFIDLHKDHAGSSKGTAYVQYQNLRGAQMALDAMNGFELAGRPIRVQTIQERSQISEHLEDSGYGPKMDAKQRQQLMYKLARTEQEQKPGQAAARLAPSRQDADIRPTPFLVAGNMFNPEEETERNWDLDLAEDVKAEVERQYGQVKRIKVDKLSAGEVYMEFPDAETAGRAHRGLSGRFFGGRQLTASFISEALFKAHM